jgi:peptidylprolyl isomerase/peptidyl-prolyl cis-trans isomerase B (cyclophilin B)
MFSHAILAVALALTGCGGKQPVKAAAPDAQAVQTDAARPAAILKAPEALTPEPGKVRVAVIRTDKGVIRFALLEKYAPRTVANFVMLAERQYFNGLVFHRVVPTVLIQGGDPKGDGTGGPGYSVKAEFNERSHVVGTVAMARTQDPDSAGSQFYICLRPLPELDRKYTVFGKVFEGMDAAGAIARGDRMSTVTIESIPEESIPPEVLK